jgi:ABC-type phosphate transport system substrate-binding protein
MKTLLLSLFVALSSLANPVSAEPVVVVNAASAIGQLSQDEIINIFLGRYRRLPTGDAAQPIDQPESSALRAEFYRKLVNKNVNEINAYWSRLIFSGRTSPPLQAASVADVAGLLLKRPGAIAYVERSQVDKRMRIVMEFPR